jgi:alpha-galactosidase
MDTSSNVTEQRIKYIADALIDLGLAKLGYEYVNVDEGWLKGRDSSGNIIYDSVKFPSGMKALGDYIHSKGLKYGLYTSRGNVQCSTSQYQGPGSYGYYAQDMKLMASWGMDYLKCDSCGGSQVHEEAFKEYGEIRDALNATGRPVFFSLCGWNSWYAPVGNTLGNSWRIDGDGDNWGDLVKAINTMVDLTQYSQPGGRNDPDLLIGTGAGSYGPDRGGWYQTDLQSRSQFSMWCVFSAPLLISADIRAVSAYALETWSNAEAIAVNQDPGNYPKFPYPGFRLAGTNLNANSGTNIWGRALKDGSFAVVFLNNNPSTMDITCDSACFAQMKYPAGQKLGVRDLWAHTNLTPITAGSFTSKAVPGSGGCTMYRFTPQN